MHIHIVTIFPTIFSSFLSTSLIEKAQNRNIISVSLYNPRDLCKDKHQQVDDTVYGGGPGMLLKAEPIIATVESIIGSIEAEDKDFLIVFPGPSKTVFSQMHAHSWSKHKHIIFVCGRYEGIDARWEQYMQDKYPDSFVKVSLGQFIALGGEAPSMVMIEAISRLVPAVIKEPESWVNESYSIAKDMTNIEHPQYTKPEIVHGYSVPAVFLSGNQKNMETWRDEHTGSLKNEGGTT